MRKNQIKGILHDLLRFGDWKNPLEYAELKKKVEVNLINGVISKYEDEDIFEFFNDKVRWFKDRVEKLGGNLSDFHSAKIFLEGLTEKVEVVYKEEKFSDSIVWGATLKAMEERFKKHK